MDNCLMWGADCHGADLTAFLKSLKRLRELSCQARGGGEYEGNLGGPSVLLESILAHGSSLKNLQRCGKTFSLRFTCALQSTEGSHLMLYVRCTRRLIRVSIPLAVSESLSHTVCRGCFVVLHVLKILSARRLNLSRHIMPSKGNALQGLSALSSLTDLDLSASTVADDDLCQLSTLTQLQRLDLSSTAVTSEGLQQLCREDAPMVIAYSEHIVQVHLSRSTYD